MVSLFDDILDAPDEGGSSGVPALTPVGFPDIIRAAENSREDQVSPKGAGGEMQVEPDTLLKPGYGVRPAADNSPEERDRVGVDYANAMLKEYGSPALAGAAYNAGPGQLDQWLAKIGDPRKGEISEVDFLRQIPFKETNAYVQRVAAMAGQQGGGGLFDDILSEPSYDTKLSPEEEGAFQEWKQRFAPKDSGQDYDLRGAFKAGLTPDPATGHWPDTFKKPNHPTFSVESQYAVGPDAAKAGHWNEKGEFVPAAAAPPQTGGGLFDDILASPAAPAAAAPPAKPKAAGVGMLFPGVAELIPFAAKTPNELPNPEKPEESFFGALPKQLRVAADSAMQTFVGAIQRAAESAPEPNIPIGAGEREAIDAGPMAEARKAFAKDNPLQRMSIAIAKDIGENTANVRPFSVSGVTGQTLASAPAMVAAALTTWATKNPMVGAVMVGGATFGQEYSQERAQGISPEWADLGAAVNGLSESLGEEIPLGFMMAPGRRFLAKTLESAGAEGVQEMLTQIIQTGYDKGVLSPDMTWGQAWASVLQAGIVGAVMGGGISAGMHPFTRGEPEHTGEAPPPPPGAQAAPGAPGAATPPPGVGTPPPPPPPPAQKPPAKAAPVEEPKGPDWEPLFDEEDNQIGWHNPKTGEVKKADLSQPPGEPPFTTTPAEIAGEHDLEVARLEREAAEAAAKKGPKEAPEYDFNKTFPEPQDEALREAGRPGFWDENPANTPKERLDTLRAFHDEAAVNSAEPIAELASATEFLKTGIDPVTGRPVRPTKAERLKKQAESVLTAAPDSFEDWIGSYTDHFGEKAAAAWQEHLLKSYDDENGGYMRAALAQREAAYQEDQKKRMAPQEGLPEPQLTPEQQAEAKAFQEGLAPGEKAGEEITEPTQDELVQMEADKAEEAADAEDKFTPAEGWDKSIYKARDAAKGLGIEWKGKKLGALTAEVNAALKAREPVEQAPAAFQGLPIKIQVKKGETRYGPLDEKTGQPAFENVNKLAAYGEIDRTRGADNDPLDVLVAGDSDKAFVFDQVNAETGKFDEHKAVLGADDLEAAKAAFDANYGDGKGPARRANGGLEMDAETFTTWVNEGDTTKAIIPQAESDTVSVKQAGEDETQTLQRVPEAEQQVGEAAILPEVPRGVPDGVEGEAPDTENAPEEGAQTKDDEGGAQKTPDEGGAAAKSPEQQDFERFLTTTKRARLGRDVYTIRPMDDKDWSGRWALKVTSDGKVLQDYAWDTHDAALNAAIAKAFPSEGKAEPVKKLPKEPKVPTNRRAPMPKMQDVGEAMAGKRAQAQTKVAKAKDLEALLEQTREVLRFQERLAEDATTGAQKYAMDVSRSFEGFLEHEGQKRGGGRGKWSTPYSKRLEDAWAVDPDSVKERAAEYMGDIETLGDVLAGAKTVADVHAALKSAIYGPKRDFHTEFDAASQGPFKAAGVSMNMTGKDIWFSKWGTEGAERIEEADLPPSLQAPLKSLKDIIEQEKRGGYTVLGHKLKPYLRQYNFPYTLELTRDAPGGYHNDTDKVPDRATPLVRPSQRVEDIKREGLPERRKKGEKITAKKFMDAFGFRGVEFGNWVTGAEGQAHVNAAYDSLLDFAEVLGMPAKAISLGGKLGLAFGSRGKGFGSAHYEPDTNVINLTKTKGDGSLSHEWGHALDFNLRPNEKRINEINVQQQQIAVDRADGKIGHDEARNRILKLKTEKDALVSANSSVKALLQSINSSLTTTWDVDGAIRMVDRLLKGESHISGKRSLGPIETAKQYVDYLWNHKGWSAQLTTRYKRNADLLGKSYWGNPEELWARSFESFVFDELAAKNATSPYLVNDWVADGKTTKEAGYRGTPYPDQDERKNFALIWKGLFDQLEWNEDGSLKDKTYKPIPDSKQAVADALAKIDISKRWAELEREKRAKGQPGQLPEHGGRAPEAPPTEGVQRPEGERGAEPADEGTGGGDRRPGELGTTASDPGRAPGEEAAEGQDGAGAGGKRGTEGESPEGGERGQDRPERRVRGLNFRIAEDADYASGSPTQRIIKNIEAIKVILDLEKNGQNASQADQEQLAHYVGWGASALAKVFEEGRSVDYGLIPYRDELKKLLTPEQYAAARASVTNAHYTSQDVVRGIWDGMQALGFTGNGSVLEPGMGIGNFIGMRPDGIEPKFVGVELDEITGKIGRALYPQARVFVQGFETTPLTENSFDAVVGNVPFHDMKPADKRYNKGRTLSLHNYFIFKSLKLLKPGGIMGVVTSRYTMDAQDNQARTMMRDAGGELLGAIRLPNTAFKSNAGTTVTTDILIFRKRKEGEPAGNETWLKTKPVSTLGEGGLIQTNAYFIKHPKMILGEQTLIRGQFGPNEYAVTGPADGLREKIGKAVKQILKDTPLRFDAAQSEDAAAYDDLAPPPDTVKDNAFFERDGKLFQRVGGASVPTELSDNQTGRVRQLVRLRDKARDVLASQRTEWNGKGTAPWVPLQKELAKLYDKFVKDFGFINQVQITKRTMPDGEVREYRRYPNMLAFRDDPDAALVSALELFDEEKNTGSKSEIFTERVTEPFKEISHVDTPEEALIASMNMKGSVDLPYMAKLLGFQPSVASAALNVLPKLKGRIFKNPATGAHELSELYLAGDVRGKLAFARQAVRADKAYDENVAALEAVQPEDLKPSQIAVRIGAPWIPNSDVEGFVSELLDTEAIVEYVPSEATWHIKIADQKSAANESVWSVKWSGQGSSNAKTGEDLVNDLLNQRTTVVQWKDDDGVTHTDLGASIVAQQKQNDIKDRFSNWIWKDADRAQRLARFYNDHFNNLRIPTFNGEHLTLPGSSSLIKLRTTQLKAIWRYLVSGNTLLDHRVGAGKTFTAIAAAMESRRLGLLKKPLFSVPNHMLEQFSREFMQLYPNANIIVADERAFDGPNRRRFVGRVAAGNWDSVIMTHSSYERVQMSPKYQADYLRDEIAQYEQAIREAKASGKDNRSPTVKQLEGAKARRQAKLSELLQAKDKDKGITFEEMGVDGIFIDEAHLFKNLEFPTKITNLNPPSSQRAFDLFLKTRYIDQLSPGRGVMFLTGTPVSNSIAEMYTMQRYLAPRALAERGLSHFDAWASTFGDTVTGAEISPEGGRAKLKTRFAKFRNLPELIAMYRQFSDVVTKQDLLDTGVIKLPKVDQKLIVVPASEELTKYIAEIGERADAIRDRKVDPRTDNMLKLSVDGRKASLDMRLVKPELAPHKIRKATVVADHMAEIYKRTAKFKGTQLAFIDLSTPKSEGYSFYHDLKAELIKRKVKPEEIAYIHDADTDQKKANLFADVRAGRKRILLGSTEKMGVGTNVQKLLYSLHHVDPQWRPADIEQREGRIERQGNENEEIEIFRYVTEGSFDAYMWQTMERKARFINAAKRGDLSIREIEDVDDQVLSFAEAKALAAGNPMLLEKATIDAKVETLARTRAAHNDNIRQMEWDLGRLPGKIKVEEDRREGLEADQKTHATNENQYVIGGTTYKKHSEAIKAVGDVLMKAHLAAMEKIKKKYNGDEKKYKTLDGAEAVRGKLGDIGGFDMSYEADGGNPVVMFEGKAGKYWVNTNLDALDGGLARIENEFRRIPARIEGTVEEIATLKKRQSDYTTLVKEPFGREKDYRDALERQRKVDIALGLVKPSLEERLAAVEAKATALEKQHKAGDLNRYQYLQAKKVIDQERAGLSGENPPRWEPDKRTIGFIVGEDFLRQEEEDDLRFQTAYHGGPHDFDKFSTGKIGTGEGNTTFGWGLYFAGKRGVAEHYRHKLAYKGRPPVEATADGYTILQNGKPVRISDDWRGDAMTLIEFAHGNNLKTAAEIVEALNDPEKAGGWFKRNLGASAVARRLATELLDRGIQFEVGPTPRAGKVYQVNLLPKDDEWLDLDKTLGQQSDKVKAALAPLRAQLEKTGTLEEYEEQKNADFDDWKGHELVKQIIPRMMVDDAIPTEVGTPLEIAIADGQDAKAASLYLKSLGIPGSRFLDQGSRQYRLVAPHITERTWVVEDHHAQIAAKGTKAEMEAWLKERQTSNFVVFDDKDVEIEDKYQVAPVFYSALTREIENAKQAKASAGQWQAFIRNAKGLKQEEIDWAGVKEWIASHDEKTITKDELLDFLRANNIQVKEVMKGGARDETKLLPEDLDDWVVVPNTTTKYPDGTTQTVTMKPPPGAAGAATIVVFFNDSGEMSGVDAYWTGDGPRKFRDFIEAREWLINQAGLGSDEGTKFGTYTLPGGEDYRELLLTLPEFKLQPEAKAAAARLQAAEKAERDAEAAGIDVTRRGDLTDETDKARAAFEVEREKARNKNFREGHFNEPNVVAHIRFKTRTDANGKKTLFIEEIQSDWHQQGRRKGYGPQTGWRVEDEFGQMIARQTSKDEAERIAEDYRQGRTPLQQQTGQPGAAAKVVKVVGDITGVPDAPFKTTWQELAFKRMVRYAAENGFDQIAWTTGEQQADRYDLSKHVSRIVVEGFPEGRYHLEMFARSGSGVGFPVAIEEKALPDYVGKEMADRIVNDLKGRDGKPRGGKTYSGLDLKVGGEGMKGFYDKILPAFANKYGKKWGAQVGETKIGTPAPGGMGRVDVPALRAFHHMSEAEWNETSQRDQAKLINDYLEHHPGAFSGKDETSSVHVLPITTAMRDSVMEGQPLFKVGEKATFGWGEVEPGEPQQPPKRGPVVGDRIVTPTPQEQALIDEVQAIVKKLSPELPVDVFGKIMAGEVALGGFYSSLKKTIAVSIKEPLDGHLRPAGEVVHTTAHEILHFLRNTWLITPKEWETLKAAAVERGWRTDPRFAIDTRYAHLNEEIKLEESIAEAFGEGYAERWAMEKGPVVRIFAKIDRFLREVAAAFRRIMGKDATADDIFLMFETGEIGRRGAAMDRQLATEAGDVLAQVAPTPPTAFQMFTDEPHPGVLSYLRNSNLSLFQKLKGATSLTAINNTIDNWRTGQQDRFLKVARMQAAIEKTLGRPLTEEENAYLAEELSSGRKGARLEDLFEKRVRPLIMAMQEQGITREELETFLYARHAPERNARIQEINPTFVEEGIPGSGMSDDDAASIMDAVDASGRRADYDALAAMVDDMLASAVDTREEAGLLSEEQADAWRTQYQHYVPLRGQFELDPEVEADRPRPGKGFDIKGKESHRAFGRSTPARDILAYAIMQAEEAIIRAENNKIGNAIYELAETAPNANFWKVDKVTMRPVWIKAREEVQYQASRRITAEEAPFTLSTKIEGKEKRITFNKNNPVARELAMAMKGLGQDQISAVIRHFGKVNRALSHVNTTLNPEFVITNAFRDAQTALTNIQQYDIDGITKGTIKDYRKALVASTRSAFKAEPGRSLMPWLAADQAAWDRWAQEFRENGGRVYFNQLDDVLTLRKRLDKEMRQIGRSGLHPVKAIKTLGKVIENGNIGVENAIRLAAYKNARERGMTPAKAASLAKNLTVNFNRRGSWGPAMNSLYLFYNASVQGSATLLTAWKSARVRKLAAAMVVTGFMLEFLNALLSPPDDDGELLYDKVTPFDKSRNLIVMDPTGSGYDAKIPLPYGYNVFYALGRSIAEIMRGKPWLDSTANFATTTIDSFNPMGSGSIWNVIFPTVADPLIDLMRNRDYTNRPIAPDQSQYGPQVPASQRYWGSGPFGWRAVTDELSALTGGDGVQPGLVEVSPEWMDYLLGMGLGAAGQFWERTFVEFPGKLIDPTTDVNLNDIPLVRRLVGEKPPWVDKAMFYERTNEIEQARANERQYAREGRRAEAKDFSVKDRSLLQLYGPANNSREELSTLRARRGQLAMQLEQKKITRERYNEQLRILGEDETNVIRRFNSLYLSRVKKTP